MKNLLTQARPERIAGEAKQGRSTNNEKCKRVVKQRKRASEDTLLFYLAEPDVPSELSSAA